MRLSKTISNIVATGNINLVVEVILMELNIIEQKVRLGRCIGLGIH